jgi:hypothetical protein
VCRGALRPRRQMNLCHHIPAQRPSAPPSRPHEFAYRFTFRADSPARAFGLARATSAAHGISARQSSIAPHGDPQITALKLRFLIDTPAIRNRPNPLKTKRNVFSNRHSARRVKLHKTGALRTAFLLSKRETGVPNLPQASAPEKRVYDKRLKQKISMEAPNSRSNALSEHEETRNAARLKEALA